MTTRTRTVSIIDADKLPFLLRTGKVQQNAQSKGDGKWTVPNSGFTSQLKYKSVSGRFSGELAGFSFFRHATVGGTIFNRAGAYAKAQQPHVWLFEVANDAGGNILNNGSAQLGSTSGWTAGSNTSLSVATVSTPWSYNSALVLRRSTSAGTGTVTVTTSGLGLVTGSQYYIKGYIYNTDGSVTVKNGSTTLFPNSVYPSPVTDRWNEVKLASDDPFYASTGELTIECTSIPETVGGYVHISLEVYQAGITAHEIWLATAGNGYYAHDLETLKQGALDAINTASNLTYEMDGDGDLVCKSSGYSVFAAGPVPWVCGWGYVAENGIATPGQLWCATPGAEMPFSYARASRQTPTKPASYAFESAQGVPDFSRMPVLAIRYGNVDANPSQWVSTDPDTGSELFATTTRKNHSEHRYYWQSDYSETQTANYRNVYSTDGNVLFYRPAGPSTLQVGDVVGIGKATAKVTAEAASARPGGLRTIEVSSKTFDNEDMDTADIVFRMPTTLQWMTGWFDYYLENPSELPEGTTLSSIDPFPLVDCTVTTASNPAVIFRQLLGSFPNYAGDDCGVPPAYTCTTIADLWQHVDSDRALIDFNALSSLANRAGLDGVTYSMEIAPDEGDAGESTQGKEVAILSMLQGVCTTLGLRMTWKYSDLQRSWVLSFRGESSPSLIDAVAQGRMINDQTALLDKPFEILGGDYSYSALKAEYPRDDGARVQFNISDQSGLVQHKNGGKTFEVKDALTVIPKSGEASSKILSNLQSLLFSLSNLSGRVKLKTVLDMAGKMVVGDAMAIDIENVRNPLTGRQDSGEIAGQCDSMTIDIGPRASCQCDVSISRLQTTGIAPSLNVDAWTKSGSVVSVTGLATSANNNDYADEYGVLTDLSHFGCYKVDDDGSTIVERDCTCTDYSCWIWERGVDAHTYGTNVWPCTIGNINLSAGTADLTISIDASGFPVDESGGKRYVLRFAPRDDSGLQPCQHAYYGYLGDGNGVVTDSDGATHAPITCG